MVCHSFIFFFFKFYVDYDHVYLNCLNFYHLKKTWPAQNAESNACRTSNLFPRQQRALLSIIKYIWINLNWNFLRFFYEPFSNEIFICFYYNEKCTRINLFFYIVAKTTYIYFLSKTFWWINIFKTNLKLHVSYWKL